MTRILGATAIAVTLTTTVTTAFAAQSESASTTPPFTLNASTAGGIRSVQNDQTLTFVFTENNQSTHAVEEYLNLTTVAHLTETAMTCEVPGGSTISADDPACEPAVVKPGQHASMVVTTTVDGPSGATASARVCLSNGITGATGPCKTVSTRIF